MRVLEVSVVSATGSSENDQPKRKMKWKGRRGVPTAKKRRVKGM